MNFRKTIWDEFKDHEFAHAYFDEHLNTHIATQVKVLREQRGLKQEELAERAQMAQERISVLENVNYSSWTVNTLRRIAKALGVRLRVSFETFSSGINEMREFNQESLLRASLDDELDQKLRENEAIREAQRVSTIIQVPTGQLIAQGQASAVAESLALPKGNETKQPTASASEFAQSQTPVAAPAQPKPVFLEHPHVPLIHAAQMAARQSQFGQQVGAAR